MAVIIPVRNRRDLLDRTLRALDAQTFRDFEVIVVDDGSEDGAAELAAGHTVVSRPVRVIQNSGRGAVDARRQASQSTEATILAFTDSDCRPVAEWLEVCVSAIDSGADVVCGLTVPERPPLPLERTMAAGEDGGYPTCNVAYRKVRFDQVGGFTTDPDRELGLRIGQPARNRGMWADTLLAWRVIRAGGTAAFEPKALVYHHVFAPNSSEILRGSWQHHALPAMVKVIPELRATLLSQRLFFGARSRLLIYLLALFVVARRPRLVAMSMIAWVSLRLRRSWHLPMPWTQRLGVLPAEFANDVVLTAALVKGSVRSRSPVL